MQYYRAMSALNYYVVAIVVVQLLSSVQVWSVNMTIKAAQIYVETFVLHTGNGVQKVSRCRPQP